MAPDLRRPVMVTRALSEPWGAWGRRKPRLQRLAERVEPLRSPADPGEIPEEVSEPLRAIVAKAREAQADSTTSTVAISVLLAGPAAERTAIAAALSNELQADLYRVDLDAVASKYIGETEKNLEHLLAGAEDRVWVLLFEEADALFGKRTEADDDHDRYANLEASYLLAQLRLYRGIGLIAIGSCESVDEDLSRQVRYVLELSESDDEAGSGSESGEDETA
jgi:ATPase family associated with various cellular activities (AAA)